MADPAATPRLAVPADRLDVRAVRSVARRQHHQLAPAGQLDLRAIDQRAAEHVVRTDRIDRIQAQRTEHVPGTRLPAVLIAGEAIGLRLVHGFQQLAHACLRLVMRAGVRVQVGHMVAGFVAVRVLADHAGDVWRRVGRQRRAGAEQRIQLAFERKLAAEQFHVCVQVVLVEEARLPRVRLGEIAPFRGVTHAARIERLQPMAVAGAWPHEAELAIEHMLVIARAMAQPGGIGMRAGGVGQVRHGPVVVRVFERLADRLAFPVAGDVAELAVERQATVIVVHRALAEQRPRLCVVDAGEAFCMRLGDYHRRVVADHATGLHALQRPYRRAVGTLAGHPHQAVDQVRHTLRLVQREQWMLRTIGIPQRVSAVVVGALRQLVHGQVHAAIAAVDIAEQGRRQHGVIKRGVEDGAGIFGHRVDADAAELAFP